VSAFSKLTPTVYITHAIIERNDKYLLVEEKNKTWYVPAGRVENNENILEGMKREVFEEAGIEVEVIGLISIDHSFVETLDYGRIGKIHFIFHAKPILDLPLEELRKEVADDETLQSNWFTEEEIKKLVLRGPEVYSFIDQYKRLKYENKILPIEFFNSTN